MDKDRRDGLTDSFLIDLCDSHDRSGRPLSVAYFQFSEESDKELLDKLHIDFSELTEILDFCLSREYLERTTLGGGYQHLRLTETGLGRGLSADAEARGKKPIHQTAGSITIGTINAEGNVDVSNVNQQLVIDSLSQIVKAVGDTDHTEEEKTEAKNLLSQFLEHPVTVSIVGAAATAVFQNR